MLVYGVLVLAGAWALVTTWPDAWVLVSVYGAAASLLATALVAGPTHGRLRRGRDERSCTLLLADQVRLVGAVCRCSLRRRGGPRLSYPCSEVTATSRSVLQTILAPHQPQERHKPQPTEHVAGHRVGEPLRHQSR